MANIFESIGRSNLSSEVGRLSETVLRMRQDERQGQVQNMQMETERLQQTKMRNELAEAERKKAFRARPYDVTADPQFLAFSEPTRQQILKDMQASGIVNEQGHGTLGDIMDWREATATNTDTFKKYLGPEIENKKKSYLTMKATVEQQVAEGKLKGDKAAEAQAQVNAAYEQYASSFENYTTHINKLEEVEISRKNALELEKVKQEGRIKAIQTLQKEKAKLAGSSIKIGSNKEQLLSAIRTAGGVDKLNSGDKAALSVIMKTDSMTKDFIATKMAVKEMESDRRYGFEKDKNKKVSMLREAKSRMLNLLESLDNQLDAPSASMEGLLKSDGASGRSPEEFSDDELKLLLDSE